MKCKMISLVLLSVLLFQCNHEFNSTEFILDERVTSRTRTTNPHDSTGILHNYYAKYLLENHEDSLTHYHEDPQDWVDYAEEVSDVELGLTGISLDNMIENDTTFNKIDISNIGSYLVGYTSHEVDLLTEVYDSVITYDILDDSLTWRAFIIEAEQELDNGSSVDYPNKTDIYQSLSILYHSPTFWAKEFEDGGGNLSINTQCLWEAVGEDYWAWNVDEGCGDQTNFEDRVACTTYYSLHAYWVCDY